MRKHLLVLSLTALLSACTLSLPDLTHFLIPGAPTAAPVQPATRTVPPSETPAFTPTVSTPTFTLTPTLIGGLPTASESSTPASTSTVIQLVVGSALTQTSFVKGFVSIILSAPEIFWGDCDDPSAATVTAQVSEPLRIVNVSLFLRLKNKTSEVFTDWDSGTLMNSQHNGTFIHTIVAENIKNHFNYSNAWVQLQLVSTDGNGRILDRTPVFPNGLALLACP